MNTHEEFVSIETAKLLKQAGFDWELVSRYAERIPIGNEEPPQFMLLTGDDMGHQNWNGYTKYEPNLCSAPTQAVAQRWLRERHSLDIIINRHKARGWRCWVENDILPHMKDTEIICLCVTETAPTYEAALEAGLQKCLTLILEEKK
ncbi:MAG: hypothetical protein IJ640_00215 [Prevotella sp.]|nr:hypothetical protein [Prevotella sp.]